MLFDFSAPIGGLTWDLNGPDDIDFTEDDDLIWESGLDGSNSTNYFASIDPPFTVCIDCFPDDAVPVPPNGTLLLATLKITATILGKVTLDTGLATEGFGIIDNYDYSVQEVEDGTERAELTVVALGDGNGDGAVDIRDFAILQVCFTGSGPSDVEGVCTLFDFDSDDDIDLDDFAVFQDAVTGPNG